jgi:hypothetical protein
MNTIPPAVHPNEVRISVGGLEGKIDSTGGRMKRKKYVNIRNKEPPARSIPQREWISTWNT